MNTTHSLPDALIVLALVGGFAAWLYFRSKDRQRRMEIVHQERMIAMEKGIPLPELPADPVKAPPDPNEMLIHGVAWMAMGMGGVVAFLLTGMHVNGTPLWPLPLPLLFLGVGLTLVHVFDARRRR